MQSLQYLVGDNAAQIAWWQMCIRAVVIFLYAVILYRIAPRRSFGRFAVIDIVFTLIVGSSLSRALTGNAPLVPSLAATAVLVALHALVSALSPRSELASWIFKGRPVHLISQGEVDWRAARHANLGARDLEEELRMNGLREFKDVEDAYLERNGAVSVIAAGSK